MILSRSGRAERVSGLTNGVTGSAATVGTLVKVCVALDVEKGGLNIVECTLLAPAQLKRNDERRSRVVDGHVNGAALALSMKIAMM